jgi:diguanylate cyclase
MLHEVGELGSHTERFDEQLGSYADAIERADSLAGLAGAVREMVEQSRSVRAQVERTRVRLSDEHQRATGLAERVRQLEDELRRLSDEASTDPLTGVANRRGLQTGFDAECARAARSGEALAIGLIDLDDFKRLNDSLGHAAGDQALIQLAARVRGSLRPSDVLARFGGEEFVVLLPGTTVLEAQQTLGRVQRALSAGLFMHDNRSVLVTFSAGVTAVQPGERIEQALERADEALYEAKRTGKNKTCIA